MLQVLQQLQLSVCTLGKDRCAEGLHDLLDGDILVGELVSSGAASTTRQQVIEARDGGRIAYQTRPNAPMPTGWRSEYRDVISNVVPKIWARTNSAMMGDGILCGIDLLVGWRGNEGFRKHQRGSRRWQKPKRPRMWNWQESFEEIGSMDSVSVVAETLLGACLDGSVDGAISARHGRATDQHWSSLVRGARKTRIGRGREGSRDSGEGCS